MKRRLSSLVIASAAAACVAACASPAAPAATVKVAKATGSRQCEGGGMTIEAMQRELTEGGVQVVAAGCGHDGMVHPMVCGAPDGRLGVFEIAAADAAKAAARGYRRLAELPEARSAICR